MNLFCLASCVVSIALVAGCGGGGGGDDPAPLTLDIVGFTLEGENAQGYLEYRHEQTGIVFVKLPGGTFEMGSTDHSNECGGPRDDEVPVHTVTLSAFLIAKYEVTQRVWKTVTGLNPSRSPTVHREYGSYPVDDVSWQGCQDFCEITGLDFPIEARWEYACRAGTRTFFGGTGVMDEMGWFEGNSAYAGAPDTYEAHEVGLKAPNHFGLYDMHGNVREWCKDTFVFDFYSQPKSREPNPVSTETPESGSHIQRVLRGGSAGDSECGCRSALRLGYAAIPPRYLRSGFRPVYNLPQ
jgi:formylglycine-generating enzyme required for sulfatase activity